MSLKNDRKETLARHRIRIGQRIRALRTERRWTQRDLSERLELSQGRLSRIENGQASLAAEEFLLLLQLFNTDLRDFVDPVDNSRGIQNALARYGAAHLREDPEIGIDPAHGSPLDVVRAVLLQPKSERLVTALSPVLIVAINEIPLPSLQHDLERAGVPNRLGWLVENTATASQSRAESQDLRERLLIRRAQLLFDTFVAHTTPSEHAVLDPFDQGVRSKKTLQRIWHEASPISRRWRIASALQVDDFAGAIREAFDHL